MLVRSVEDAAAPTAAADDDDGKGCSIIMVSPGDVMMSWWLVIGTTTASAVRQNDCRNVGWRLGRWYFLYTPRYLNVNARTSNKLEKILG